ncbi:hypothetical protein [Halorhabdus salina]|uniref:hypothetical protein n=1 Tax=Halorhabdus salina TaxID=2750670 RepID=UPI0015EF3248|nr:hypothetical protein [Halorhabdus salina]
MPVNRDWGPACEAAQNAIETTLDVSAPKGAPVDFPVGNGAEMLSAADYLEQFTDSVETVDTLCIGVTDDPLFEDPKTSTTKYFGIGFVGGETGLVSTKQLQRWTDDDTKIRTRYRKETLIIAGRLHGLENHREPDGSWVDSDSTVSCVMTGGRGLRWIDDAPEEYCEECWEDIRAARRSDDIPVPGAGRIFIELLRSVIPAIRRPAREYPAWVHGLVRTVRFWTKLAGYALSIGVWLVVLQSGYESSFGSQPPTEVLWVLIVGAIPLGIVSVWFAVAVLSGLSFGLTGSETDWD